MYEPSASESRIALHLSLKKTEPFHFAPDPLQETTRFIGGVRQHVEEHAKHRGEYHEAARGDVEQYVAGRFHRDLTCAEVRSFNNDARA
jgi:hypothetical protein